VLLAGLFADGETTVVEPEPTRDHTELALALAGIPVRARDLRITVSGWFAAGRHAEGRDWRVPGDFSSAAFWMAAAACREGAEVVVEGVGINPRRTAFLDVLRRMGAAVEVRPDAGSDGPGAEPAGTVTVRGGPLRATEVGGAEIPNLIDELPLVAVLGARAEGTTTIRDAEELRVKETDRIATVVEGLRVLGVEAEAEPDGLRVRGGAAIRGRGTVQSHGDHRIAMALSILSLFADAPVRVADIACVATSYPEFWTDMEKVVRWP
jgi:3-phosphoshikimate 1-carboxyvinyltransferase